MVPLFPTTRALLAAISTTLHTATLVDPICAKRFHRHHRRQPALMNRPYRGTSAVRLSPRRACVVELLTGQYGDTQWNTLIVAEACHDRRIEQFLANHCISDWWGSQQRSYPIYSQCHLCLAVLSVFFNTILCFAIPSVFGNTICVLRYHLCFPIPPVFCNTVCISQYHLCLAIPSVFCNKILI